MTSALKNLCGPGKPLRPEAPDQAELLRATATVLQAIEQRYPRH